MTIHKISDIETVNKVKSELGIETVCISAETIDEMETTINVLGKVLRAEDRANELNEWINKKLKYIDSITEKIPEKEKKTAILLGSDTGTVAGAKMLQAYMIEKAGGINLTNDITDDDIWPKIGVEEIFKKNPDVVFCTATTPDKNMDKYKTDSSWSGLTAVKSGKIYKIPAKMDAWDLPNITAILGIFYMMNKMYPEYFTDTQLQTEIDEYYTFIYGKTFDKEYLGY